MKPTPEMAAAGVTEVRVHHLRYASPTALDKSIRRLGGYIGAPGRLYTSSELRERGLVANPKGGSTVVELVGRDGVLAVASAECNPSDAFNRKLGRDIAIGRALAEIDGRAAARREKRKCLT